MCAPRARAELGRDGAAAWVHGSVRAKGENGRQVMPCMRGDGDSTLRAPGRMGARRGAASQKQSTKRSAAIRPVAIAGGAWILHGWDPRRAC